MPTIPYKPSLLKRLCNPEHSVDYLTNVLKEESQGAFLIALNNVIEAKELSVPVLSKKMGVTKQGLYKILSEGGNPRLSTLNQLLASIGMRIRIEESRG